ncbi:hypothetical protein JOC37_001572 [Desulfohalotomaculum tongense]|uniref:hypothetical protein n=1 Tax=Desulforadius tongensis TaxID=1216062 RepID=UPI00195D613D|nr:hypothetical protein [Desulforadius tongensis]MBM7855187.1 hypothetical protein [Desulforadius tongensis]
MDRYFKALSKVRDKLLQQRNVVGVGVGHKEVRSMRTKQLSMVVLVEKKLPPENLKRGHIVPRKVEGIDTDVIEVGRIKMLFGGTERKERIRPAVPGCSVGHYRVSAGTLGAVVRDRISGEKLILSNNHILANGTNGYDGRAAIGDPILQPGSYDGGNESDRIARLFRFIPINRGIASEQQVSCPIANGFSMASNALLRVIRPNYQIKVFKKLRQANSVDCALARPDRPDLIDNNILGIGEVKGIAEARPGIPVIKSGRTTGVTTGVVTTIGTSLKVEMDDNEVVLFNDQVTTDLKSRGGDSGSLVLTPDNRAVGLLFAGSDSITVFNPIQRVMEALQIEF